MGSIFTLSIIQSALELGCIYSLVALALFISFSILNIADLSTDGCFTLRRGCCGHHGGTSVSGISGGYGCRRVLRICDGIPADEDGRAVHPCRNYCEYGTVYSQYCCYGICFECKFVWL